MTLVTCPNGHLSIDEHREGGLVRLALVGELDIASAPLLEERISQLRAEVSALRLDLSELDFIDSAGLHAVLRAHQDQAGGLRIQIDPRLSPQAERLFKITGADALVLGPLDCPSPVSRKQGALA